MTRPATESFRSRAHAGCLLARELEHLKEREDLVVLALPRGGVAVGFEVARALGAPLDIFLTHRLVVPGTSELTLGWVSYGGSVRLHEPLVGALGLSDKQLGKLVADGKRELQRLSRELRGQVHDIPLRGRTVVLVDEGVAAGSALSAAAASIRSLHPASILAAVPMGSREGLENLSPEVDGIICPRIPDAFDAVPLWYEDFAPLEDAQLRTLLDSANEAAAIRLAARTGLRGLHERAAAPRRKSTEESAAPVMREWAQEASQHH